MSDDTEVPTPAEPVEVSPSVPENTEPVEVSPDAAETAQPVDVVPPEWDDDGVDDDGPSGPEDSNY